MRKERVGVGHENSAEGGLGLWRACREKGTGEIFEDIQV